MFYHTKLVLFKNTNLPQKKVIHKKIGRKGNVAPFPSKIPFGKKPIMI
jgi:hypothetical protein